MAIRLESTICYLKKRSFRVKRERQVRIIMAELSLPHNHVGKSVPFSSISSKHILLRSTDEHIKWPIRYIFYAFIFLLPFEEAYVAGGTTTLPKFFGLALAAFAVLQPRLCYEFPPKAFWWLVIYLFIHGLWSSYLFSFPPNVPDISSAVVTSVFRLVQFLVLFWISYNLLKQERIVNGAFWALSAACILLAVLQILGVTSAAKSVGRVTAFDSNPNGVAAILSLGLLALFGLAYGRTKNDWKARLVFWFGAGILAVAIIQTGSRGPLVAVLVSLAVFFLKGKNIATKLKFGVIALAGVLFLVMVSTTMKPCAFVGKKRFMTKTWLVARIYPAAIGMILESPLIGWGPINHAWELGPRVGEQIRDEHNVYLWILAEVGLIGVIPFFIALRLSWRSAWSARNGVQGIFPVMILLFVLTASMSRTNHNRKYYWVILSHALAASGAYAVTRKTWNPVPLSRNPAPTVPSYVATRNKPGVVRFARSPAARGKNLGFKN